MSAADSVRSAWLDQGRSPLHHKQAQATLEKHWPTLAEAIKALVAERPEPSRFPLD